MTDDIYDATGKMIRTWDEEKKKYKEKYGQDVDYILAQEMENDGGFQKAMVKTRKNEGGYINHPNDPGGETKFGIPKKWYPNEDIKNLSRDRADYLLYRDKYRKTKIEYLPDNVRDAVFDNAVLQGAGTAIIQLQEIVGTKPDGKIGKRTLQKTNDYDKGDLLEQLERKSKDRSEKLIKINQKLKDFKAGWDERSSRY